MTICYLSICSSKNENVLSFHARCDVDYDLDVLRMSFDSYKIKWNLRKIRIFYNGTITKENSFSNGIASSGLFNEIAFEFSIRDMNIPFFGNGVKSFVFALEYEKVDDNEIYETRFVIKKFRAIIPK